MKTPITPSNEPQRLAALHGYQVLDTAGEPAFDALTALAAHIADVPIALVSLVDAERQWFKSRHGLQAAETPRDVSFCGHVVASESALLVPDALQDERFADNPLVLGGPQVRFYLGVPLRTNDGFVLGTLCAIDHRPRQLSASQRHMLSLLAQQVVDQLELRRSNRQLQEKQRQLEASLADVSETRSRVQSILASANCAIIETTPDGTIREFNAAAIRMLGYTAEEVVGKQSPAIIHDLDEVVAHAAALSVELAVQVAPGFETFTAKPRRGIPDEREWTYVRKDGSRFPVALSITPRLASDGSLVGFMGIAMDVSARRRAESQLRERELLLKTVFAGMAEGVVVQDRSGAIREANEAAESILGLSRDQLIGRASVDPEWQSERPDGSPFPGEEHPSTVTLRSGEPQHDVLMALTRSGGRRALISINSQPLIFGQAGEGAGAVVTTFRDITRQAETEQALRDSEERSRAIIQTAADAIITIDESGRINRVNPAVERLFGFAPHELVGANVSKLMPSPDHERHDGYLARYVAGGPPKVIGVGREVTARRKDGSTFAADLAVSEFMVAGQRNFTGMIRDISDRKRVERMQAEFVSTVSHELRTPLTSIRGSLGLMAGGVLGVLPGEAKLYVDIALSNCERLVRLINDILDIEKLSSNGIDFHLRSLELGTAVRAALVANEAYAAGFQVKLVLADELPDGEVLADPDRLSQVLANLISNAAKFSPTGAPVELSVQRSGDWFRVNVRDHGPGIDKEFAQRIFQRFAQADGSTTRDKGGTGLGLSISQAIVEKMGGRIGFRPAEGAGTVFYFELPYLHPVRPFALDADDRGRVLVCEDDIDAAHTLERILTSAGYAVHIAPTLERARRLLAQNSYVAVTLDLTLADGDARTLLDELRASRTAGATPVVVVSGTPHEDRSNSASAVVSKPPDASRLLTAIAQAVAGAAGTALRLLHVEADPDLRQIVKKTMPVSWHVVSADSLQAGRDCLATTTFDVVLLELSLPDGDGTDLLGEVGKAQVILFSGLDVPSELQKRVAAALVKSRSTPLDVRAAVVAAIGKRHSLAVRDTK